MHNFTRPLSDEDTETITGAAYALAMKGEYDAALDLCNWLMEDEATLLAGQRERAAVFSHRGDTSLAITDLLAVVAVAPSEPADLHALGLLYLQDGALDAAQDCFQCAIDAGEAGGNSYYTNSSLLLGAFAQLQAGEHASALATVTSLPDDYRVFVPGIGMRSKLDILNQARAALRPSDGEYDPVS